MRTTYNVLYVEVIDKKVDLVRKRRVIVKEEEKKQILRMCHDGIDGMHFGRDKTYGKVYHCLETYLAISSFQIVDKFYWKGIHGDVQEFCKRCDECDITGAGQNNVPHGDWFCHKCCKC